MDDVWYRITHEDDDDVEHKVTEADPVHVNAEDIHCACNAVDRRRKSTKQQAVPCSRAINGKCYKNGSGCGETCTCSSCANPLNILTSFFGKDGMRADPCFRHWLNDYKKKSITIDLTSPIVHEYLRSELFGVEEGNLNAAPTPDVFVRDGYDEDLLKPGKDWLKPGVTDGERQSLLQKLFRIAFGTDKDGSFKPYFLLVLLEWLAANRVHTSLCNVWGLFRLEGVAL